MTAIDLGHGTTEAYIGGPDLEPCSVWAAGGRRLAIPTRQLLALSLSLQHGNAEAAHRMGIAESTVKNLLTRLNRKLGVFGKWEAATVLGWVSIPPELLDASPEVDLTIPGGRSVAGPGLVSARQLDAGPLLRQGPRVGNESPGGYGPGGTPRA